MYCTFVSFRTILEEGTLEDLAAQESQMTDWAEKDDLDISLGRRSYNDFQLWKTLLRLIILQKKQNFDPLNRTTPDDAAAITNLEASINIIATKVKSKQREFEIPPQPLPKTIDIYVGLAMSMLNEMGKNEDMDE